MRTVAQVPDRADWGSPSGAAGPATNRVQWAAMVRLRVMYGAGL